MPENESQDDKLHDVQLEQQLEQISHLLEDGLLLVDFNQMIVFANAPASKMLGAELVNRPLSKVLSDVSFDDIFNNIQTRKRPHEFIYTHRKAVMRQFRIKLTPMGGAHVGVLLLDMTLQRNLDKVRRDFVANVSHELRSPLTALIGFIETLQTVDDVSADDQRHFLGIMEEESKRMTRLIDDLISLSRVEVEEHIIPDEQVPLDEVIGSVVAIFADRAAKQNMVIDFTNHLANTGSLIQGDRDEIVEVFHNLIENAIKYGFADRTIAIEMKPSQMVGKLSGAGGVCVRVTNFGEGIEERHIPRLTERFYRVDKARSRQKGGTGLGLAIVKHIVNRHRGEMTIESAVGAQTSFTIHLPLLG